MPTLGRKLKELFRDNVQQKDYLRPRQKWTEEIGNKEMLVLLSMKPIVNLNIRDWISIKRINGLTRLKEKRCVYWDNQI